MAEEFIDDVKEKKDQIQTEKKEAVTRFHLANSNACQSGPLLGPSGVGHNQTILAALASTSSPGSGLDGTVKDSEVDLIPPSILDNENDLQKDDRSDDMFGGMDGSGRDAKYEFFSLTALAIKINNGELMDSLYTISTKDLWNMAQTQQVKFHQYYHWIETQLTKAYITRLYPYKRHWPLIY